MSNAFSLHKHDAHHAGSAAQQHQSTTTSAASSSSKTQQNGAHTSTQSASSRFQPLYPPESLANSTTQKILTSTGAAKPSILASSAPSKQHVQQPQPQPQPQPPVASIKPPPAPTKHVAPVIKEQEQTTVVQDSSPGSTTSIHSKGITFTIDKRYSQLKVIGKGAYGIVVSGYDTVEKRKVAIKKSLHAFDNLLLSRRLLRELVLLRQLNHENIIRLYDIQKPSTVKNWNEVYMVTDLMETDLNQIIKSEQPLTIEHVQFFMYQMIRGMKYLHSAGILHRDLKPSNILINSNCDIKICDLGLARAFDYGDISEGNKLTEYVVTRWYRSPELLLNDKMYTISVDIWSLGCIMAELFTRKPLFQGRNYLDQLNKIIYVMGYPTSNQIRSMTMTEAASKNLSQIPRYPKLNLNDLYKHAKIPQDALDLIDKMLAFSPSERITAEQALEHPFFEGLHNPEDEPVADFKVDLSFEKEATSVESVKRLLYKEILRYHPNPPGTPDPFSQLEQYSSESSDEDDDELSPMMDE